MSDFSQLKQYQDVLTKIGLSENQAFIYEVMLKLGPSSARKISNHSPLKRPLTYKILDELIELGLAEKEDPPSQISTFEPLHPNKLQELMEVKLEETKSTQTLFEESLGHMISDFNLISGKPGVQFFEGIEGIRKTNWDSLSSKTEILTFLDNEAVAKYIPDIDADYVKTREKKGISKKIISPDTNYIKKIQASYEKPDLTQIKIMPGFKNFATVMQIYDGKVSFSSLGESMMVGMIIQDKRIYKMQKDMFSFIWQNARLLVPVEKSSDSRALV